MSELREIKEDIESLEAMLVGLDKELKRVVKAFPRTSLGEIDCDGHRHYHESLIRSAQQQEKFWMELREDLTKKGLTAIMLIVAGLIVTGFGVELKTFLANVGK